jgi:O-antigen/teichoic acid export membrane protein
MLRPLIFRTLITNTVVTAVGLMNSILLSRWLGPTGRGEIAAAMLWPTMLVYLSSFGLIAAVLYFAALPESKPQPLFVNATILAIAQSALAMGFGFAALPWLLHSQTATVVSAGRWYLLVIPLSLVTQYGISILQGRLQMTRFNWLRLILPVGYLIGTVALMIVGHLKLDNIIFLHLALNVITLCATLFALVPIKVRPGLHFDGGLARQMLAYGAKIHIGNISALANTSLDQVLMAALLSADALGIYVVALSAASVLQVFNHAVLMVSTPAITQKETPVERAAVLQGIFRRYWVLSLLITLAVAMLLPVAIPLVFGASFKTSILPAEILLLGLLFIGAKELLAGGAQALGNPWLGSKAQLVALVVTLTLLYFLLPVLGIVGAAIATAIAYATQLVVAIIELRRVHAISPIELFRIDSQDVVSMFHIFSPKKAV